MSSITFPTPVRGDAIIASFFLGTMKAPRQGELASALSYLGMRCIHTVLARCGRMPPAAP